MSPALINVLGWVLIALIALAFVMMIDWRKIAAKWVANNPARARVYVAAGEQIDTVDGKLYYPGVKGAIYTYRWRKIRLAVYVPCDYPYKYLSTSGRRMINVYAGNGAAVSVISKKINEGKDSTISKEYEAKLARENSAAPLDWKIKTDQVNVNAHDLNSVIRSNIGAELVSSLFGRHVNWVMTIVILAAVLVGGFILIKNNLYPDNPPAQEQPSPETVEEALRREGVIE